MDFEHKMFDVVQLLNLPLKLDGRESENMPCPCCDSGKGKHLNINYRKNVFRCPRCDFHGGVLDLYAFYRNTDRTEACEEIGNILSGAAIMRHEVKEVPVLREPVEYPENDIGVRHATYTALLSSLTLAKDHYDNLASRGLSKRAIEANGYRTIPAVGRKQIADKLLEAGFYLAGVPGFHRNGGGDWIFSERRRGIMIPVRDLEGKIQGIQIRFDKVVRNKFAWLSSANLQDGCRAKGVIHCVGPVQQEMLLIEGPLKADIVHHLTGQSFIALPGVSAHKYLPGVLNMLRTKGVRKIMTALDMDYVMNPFVANAYRRINEILDASGMQYGRYVWMPSYNGLDDYVWEYYFDKIHS